MRKIINFLIKFPLYALVFLIPLFWLPLTIEVYEFNKQYLLVFLVSLSFLAWLAKLVVVRKKLFFRRTALDFWILVFMLIMILSAVFSIDEISSWFGFYGRFSGSVIGILALIVLYFVVVNNVESVKSEKGKSIWGLSLDKIYSLFIVSSWITIIVTYLSIFNLWSKIPNMPGTMFIRSFNPVGGSLEGLSIFLAMAMSLVVGLVLSKSLGKKKIISMRIVFLIVSLILLFLINFSAAWVVLGVTMFILLVMAFWTRIFRERVNLLTLPIILLLISTFYLFGLPAKIGFLSDLDTLLPLPQELILDSGVARTVAWQSLKDYPVLGSGPGTYVADFVKFKPVEFNNDEFWNVRFDRGSSHIMEMIGTTGVLGILSYILILGIFLLIGLVFLSRKRLKVLSANYPISDRRHPISVFPLILAWISLLVAQFVYMQNTVLSFYFWFFMALGVVVWQGVQNKPFKKISFTFDRMPEVGLVMNVILIILVFALAGLFYMGGRFYLADVRFIEPVESKEELVSKIEKSIILNNYRENYRQALSQAYLITAWAEANKPEEEQNIQLLQALASGSIQQARIATSLSPNSVSAWENLGAIYRDTRGLVGGILPFALEAFAQATELEPTNPFFYRERCRLNLISEEKDWDETIGYCQRAIELKDNYLDAHVQLALVYEQKGDLEAALERMKGVLEKLRGVSFQRDSDFAGAATEIYFQTGRLYFNLERIKEAVPMFEQAVIITPQYANGRYALALTYETDGRTEDALIQYQILSQMMPDDENIAAKVQELGGAIAPISPIEGEVVE
ncbi:tetratricopeptide repeat protein [Patescibacteria group bacterium]|nr:tetratricopeptide repeat protein [Patescibacteria group bacterium]